VNELVHGDSGGFLPMFLEKSRNQEVHVLLQVLGTLFMLL
jgi:hypothetical protein